MDIAEFKKGDRVLYVPNHADEDLTHKDCESGVVSSVNAVLVFVKFDPKNMRVRYVTGDEDITAQGCRPEDLMVESTVEFINKI